MSMYGLIATKNRDGFSLVGGCLTSISCLPMTLFFLAALIYMIGTAVNFLNNGITTEGRVESCEFDAGGFRSNDSTTIAYSYDVVEPNGQSSQLQAREKIINNYIDCDDAPVGSTIQIQYLADTPLDTQIIDSRITPPILDALLPHFALLVLGIFSFLSSILGFLGIYRHFKPSNTSENEGE